MQSCELNPVSVSSEKLPLHAIGWRRDQSGGKEACEGGGEAAALVPPVNTMQMDSAPHPYVKHNTLAE